MKRSMLLVLTAPFLFGCGGSTSSGSSSYTPPAPNSSGNATTKDTSSTPTPGTGTIIGILSTQNHENLVRSSYKASPSLYFSTLSGTDMHRVSLKYAPGDWYLVPKISTSAYNLKTMQIIENTAQLYLKTSFKWRNIQLIPKGSFFLKNFESSQLSQTEAGFQFSLKTRFSENLHSTFSFIKTHENQTQSVLEFSARF